MDFFGDWAKLLYMGSTSTTKPNGFDTGVPNDSFDITRGGGRDGSASGLLTNVRLRCGKNSLKQEGRGGLSTHTERLKSEYGLWLRFRFLDGNRSHSLDRAWWLKCEYGLVCRRLEVCRNVCDGYFEMRLI